MVELSIIIVNRSGGRRLEECLASVEEERAGKEWEVLVVDNASQDRSPDMVERRFPWASLFRNAENIGFARANNQGAASSRGEFVLFLNPDTVVRPGALELLLREMREYPGTGAAGPALLAGKDSFQVSFGGKVHFIREMARKSVLNAWRRRRLPRLRKKRRVVWVSGACLMTSREVLARTGGFDENFFLYFEDIDLCYRIREQGYEVVFIPEARIFHAGGEAAARVPLFSRLEYRRSQLYFYEKHNSRLSLWLLRAYLWLSARMGGVLGSRGGEGECEERAFRRELLSLIRARGRGTR